MRALMVPVGEPPRVIESNSDLRALQKTVGGHIELLAVDSHVGFLGHDTARIDNQPFNRYVVLSDRSVWDIFGPLLLVGVDDAEGIFESLSADDIALWQPRLEYALSIPLTPRFRAFNQPFNRLPE